MSKVKVSSNMYLFSKCVLQLTWNKLYIFWYYNPSLFLDNPHQMIRLEGDYWLLTWFDSEKKKNCRTILVVTIFYLGSTEKPVKSLFIYLTFCTGILFYCILFKLFNHQKRHRDPMRLFIARHNMHRVYLNFIGFNPFLWVCKPCNWKQNMEKQFYWKRKNNCGIENDLMQNLTYRHDGTYFVEKLIKYKRLLRRHRENVFAISSTEKKI